MHRSPLLIVGLIAIGLNFDGLLLASDPLPSWNDSVPKKMIVEFVQRVTQVGATDFIPKSERIAVFDNDGTLWAEQPIYFQALFVFDRIRQQSAQRPQWKTEEPFASVLKGDLKTALAGGEHALLKMAMATHAGMTTDQFEKIVKEWIQSYRHPETGKLLTDMVYLPMVELLDYLRANGFKTYIVSGGGIEFMRAWSEQVYRIPPEQVIGSSIKTSFEFQDGQPVIVRLPELNFIDDKAGKPAAIQHHLGRRPVFAVGNSDGDLQMLQWTAAGSGPRFCLYVHHTDADREWAYDRQSHVGRLDQGLTEAAAKGWTVASIKDDWKVVWPPSSLDNATNLAHSIYGNWLAEDILGTGVIDDLRSTMQIETDGTVFGSTGVNQYRGKVTVQEQSIRFGPLATTRRAGAPAAMDQEQKFTKALDQAVGFRVDANQLLYLIDDQGNVVLRFSILDN